MVTSSLEQNQENNAEVILDFLLKRGLLSWGWDGKAVGHDGSASTSTLSTVVANVFPL